MSGSGSTMYAIIEKSSLHNVKKTIEEKKLFEGMDVCYV
jgi:4-diphosphocytidyl-2C-methyl-D-erythritol kinase